jgi:hypothetical protein
MKRILNLILIALVVFISSCKKDESSADLNSVEGINKALVSGYWQHIKYNINQSTTLYDSQSYWAYQFKSGNKLDSYFAKGETYNTDQPYRVKMYNGRVVFVFYNDQTQYDQDDHTASSVYDIYFKNGELYLENKTYNSIDVYKNYSSMAATKDLPPSS